MRNSTILIPLLAWLAGCTDATSERQQARYVQCDTVRTTSGTVPQSRFPGRVKAASEANIAFRVAGQIAQMNVSQGQFVREGTVIARLDDRDYRTRLAATEAEYAGIRAEADRVTELFQSKSVTPNEYDKAVYGLQQISAKLEADRNALSYTRLIAPFDGYVQKKFFDMGETVGAGTAVVSVVSAGSTEIEIHLPSADFIRREEFDRAWAEIDLFPDTTFLLERIGINRKANLNQLYTAAFRFRNAPQVAPGMNATVTIRYAMDRERSVQIPVTALSADSVWVLRNGRAHRKPIQVKRIHRDGTAQVEGLCAGELVISSGINSLEEGQPVRAMPVRSATNAGGVL